MGSDQILDAVCKFWESCHKCDFSNYRKRLVHTMGSPNADFMVIGLSPGIHEENTGRPFQSSQSGRFIFKMIATLGLNSTQTLICNILACRPCNSEESDTRAPTDKEINNCRPRIAQLLEVVKPRVVMCIGDRVARMLFPKSTTFPLRFCGASVYKTFDPVQIATSGPLEMQLRLFRNSKTDWEYAVKDLRDLTNADVEPSVITLQE